VVPTVNNPAGNYEISLYYTAAEKAAWESATGQSWSSIQLVKVPGQIADYSPSAPTPHGSGAVTTAVPSRGTLGTQYVLTATFSTGFSGFGAGIINTVLPTELLSFEGKLSNERVRLEWVTSLEEGTTSFDIEKSAGGVDFFKIGSVNAVGNTASPIYSFVDNKPGQVNYYRLRMKDKDGKHTFSKVVLIRLEGKEQGIAVLNNPFNNHISIQFKKEAGNVRLRLIDVNGSIVATQLANSAHFNWQLPSGLKNGIYILEATIGGKLFNKKLVKQ
jgi:hypothetical protein